MIQAAFEHPPEKTYATAHNAIDAFAKACAKTCLAASDVMRYVLCTTEFGRFYCIGLPNAEQVQAAIDLARLGFPVFRN